MSRVVAAAATVICWRVAWELVVALRENRSTRHTHPC
jgi:hypothetical protein